MKRKVPTLSVHYEWLQLGQIPILGRPEKAGALRSWSDVKPEEISNGWQRLLLDEEGMAASATGFSHRIGWRLVAPQTKKNMNFCLDMFETPVNLVEPFLRHAAAMLPKPRGQLVAVLHPGATMLEAPAWVYWGLLHELEPRGKAEPPPAGLAKLGAPREIQLG
jgi:hypothetical protein